MACYAGPNAIQSGLLIKLDPANVKSYPGTGLSMIDISNSGNNASLISGVVFDTGNGGCLQTSSGKYISVAPNSTINSTGIHSFSVWFYVTGTYPLWNGLIGKGLNDTVEQYDMMISSNLSAVYCDVGNNVGPYLQINQNVSSGVWHNLTYTCGAGTGVNKLKMYYDGDMLNGNTIATNYSMNSDTGSPLTIGATNAGLGGSNFFFLGKVGSFEMYNRDISAAEVSGLFIAQRGRYGR